MFPGEGLRVAIKIPHFWCSMGEDPSGTRVPSVSLMGVKITSEGWLCKVE